MSGHVVLVGDSIFDNAIYVPNGPCVTSHLNAMLPDDWSATLVAVDGATVSSAFGQLSRIPDDATYLVLSVGGNDGLWTASQLFSQSVRDVEESLERLGEVSSAFQKEYRRMVDELIALNRPLCICTIYDSVPGLGAAEKAGLCLFNDVITRIALEVGAVLIDLRNVCDEASDYSEVSPIEPSDTGGAKISKAIVDAVLGQSDFRRVVAS